MRTIPYGDVISLNGGLRAQVKWAYADVLPDQTAAQVIAAVPGKKIRVLALVMVAGATATTSRFLTKPAGAGTNISCLFANAANGGAVLNYNPAGWFETSAGEGLAVTTGAGSATGYQIVYIEVPA